jgi:hypothetical protein
LIIIDDKIKDMLLLLYSNVYLGGLHLLLIVALSNKVSFAGVRDLREGRFRYCEASSHPKSPRLDKAHLDGVDRQSCLINSGADVERTITLEISKKQNDLPQTLYTGSSAGGWGVV